MKTPNVSILEYGYKDGRVAQALELCRGLERLRPSDRVLIKPCLVGWDAQLDLPFPPFGILTTSTILEELIVALRDWGVSRITLGEAAFQNRHIKSGTTAIYQRLGYSIWEKRYGIRLKDFNKGPYKKVDLAEGFTLEITTEVDQCDFLISVPVLKTHGQTIVSLGIKNLKGLLKQSSKCLCHQSDPGLDRAIALLASYFPPHLTVIDGIYALERGPLQFGTAHRFDLIIASPNSLAADIVGAKVLGYLPQDIGHLVQLARLKNISLEIMDLAIQGKAIEAVQKRLEWDWPYTEDNRMPHTFLVEGLKGIYMPKYDETLCTGCSFINSPVILLLLSAKEGSPFPDYEVLNGKVMKALGQARKTFLLGKCIIEANRDNPAIQERIEIRGCPPRLEAIVEAFQKHGIPVRTDYFASYRRHIMDRYLRRPEVFRLEDFYLS